MSYVRFGLMILTSTVVMFILMYLNTYAWEHVFFSETRTYMAIMMGATMAVIMLAYMLGMYSNKGLNIAIFVGAIIVCLVASSTLTLVLGSIAVALATVNVVGGFLVTHRMLAMFKSRKKD